jgi:hypothetical protein
MKKFSENQVFTNFLKTHPRVRADFHSGSAFYNENIKQGNNIESGTLSLYEINVGRQAGNLVYPFISKDAAKNSFTVTTKAVYSALNPGEIITGSYPLTSSMSRDYPATASYKRALKNSLNHYRYLSPYYAYSYYESAGTNLISIPSIFYGETIKKGSVKLSCYYTGTLIAQAQDSGYNGALIQTYGTASMSGSVVGTVLYNEGFILLTSSLPFATGAADTWDGSSGQPKWTFFGPYTEVTNIPQSGSWVLEFEGQNTIPVMTMMCEAPKNEFNYSNNPTFLLSGSTPASTIEKSYYAEASGSLLKNIAKSDFVSGSEPFSPVTYISKIGIFDERKNLIAIARLARPIKKDEEDGYTFKIKLDL